MLDRVTIERMATAAGDGPILIALSGGGDSVALLHLLVERLGAARLGAVVVDHALRQGSAADAQRARGLAQTLSVNAEIVTLSWPLGPQFSQARAREERYRALCEAARKAGARVIAVAHTRDDQAETVLLRAARGSGWRGLAGMRALAPPPLWPEGRGLLLARPLLGARRLGLRQKLRSLGAEWIEDPANSNEDFARVRARQRLRALEDGLDPMRLAALAERLAPRAAQLDQDALALIRAAVRFADDTALLAPRLWRGPVTVRERALSVLLTAAGAGAGEPPAEQVAALEPQLAQTAFKGATLAGARLKGDADIAISRDSGALRGRADGAQRLPPFALEANVECIWDRRVALTALQAGWLVAVEGGRPVLARGDSRMPLTAVSSAWLLEERVEHLLQV